MIETTFRIIIENIVEQLHKNKCQNIVTQPRLSYRATPTLLEGDPYSPSNLFSYQASTAVHEPLAKYFSYHVCMADGGTKGQKLGCG